MITHVAICPAPDVETYGSRTYGVVEKNILTRLTETGHVVLITCGAALRHCAERKAKGYIGGEVITIETSGWPSFSDIEDALIERQKSSSVSHAKQKD